MKKKRIILFVLAAVILAAGVLSVYAVQRHRYAPRILTVEGAVNVRDIGGLKTADGGRIPYGLLVRGSELDGAMEPSYRITEQGKQTLLDYGIRYDFDLRYFYDGIPQESALGSGVTHQLYHFAPYTFDRDAYRRVFCSLADKTHYPMYLHCTYGIDRTGCVCYMLEALLGVSEADLRKEFELSSLYFDENDPINIEKFNRYVEEFNRLNGNSPQQKAEQFLLSCGVSQAEILSIQQIFSEEEYE